MIQNKELTPKEQFLSNLSAFLLKNRIILLSILAVIVVAIIAVTATTMIIDSRVEAGTVIAERVQRSLDKWHESEDEETKTELEEQIVGDIQQILKSYPLGYAAQRGLYLKGELAFAKENWTEAAKEYMAVADQYSESHLAPACLMKAAVAYEQAGDDQAAMNAYLTVADNYGDESPNAPRALFSVGRLSEKSESPETAKSFYNNLLDRYPSSSWTNLAKARIIYLDSLN